jgi:methyl-accepting chemotaxis protein
MTTPHKSTREPHEETELIDTLIPVYEKNVERLAELEKKSLEVAAEQSTEWIDTCKKAFHLVPDTPGLFLFDLLGRTFGRLVETQKGFIDLAVEQSHTVAGLAKERSSYATKMAEGVTTLVQQTVAYSVAAQKQVLDHVAEQNKTAYETAKKRFRISSSPAAEAFQSGMDTLIETQKAMLDIASKPLKRSAAA